MKKLRRTNFTAVVAAVALALAACGSDASDSESPNSTGAASSGTNYVTTNGSEPQNPLIPTNTNEVGGGKILDLIFEGLVYYDADGATHNAVAESIETEDAQHYTIKIKPDLKFSNGEALTASSFVDAWQYGAQLDNAQLSSYFFEPIEGFSYDVSQPLTGLEVVDDTTFTVTLSQPEADFPLRLGYSAFYPLPASAFEDMDTFGEAPVGNGPYVLESWTHQESALLVPNESYQGDRVPQNDGVDIKFYAEADAAYNDLLSDNLDVFDAVPSSAFATAPDELGDRYISQPAAIFQSFTIPDRLAHFGGEEGKLRRQAISMAINRDEITEVLFEGTRTSASDFTSPVIDGWSDSVPGSEVLEYNPEKAKELWAQADAISPWEGTFEIGYNADADHQVWVDAVTNSIKNTLGIEASGAPYPTFSELRTGVTDRTIETAFRSGWQADYPGLNNFLGPLYGTGAGSNDGDYSSPEFDALLKQGSTEVDPDAANALYQQAQEILFKDLPAIPLWYSNVNGGYSTLVDNVEFGWNSVAIYHEITKK